MLKSLKDVIKNSIPEDIRKFGQDQRALRSWEKQGRPSPPPHVVKESLIKEYAKKFHTGILIETGTYLGNMVYAMRKSFTRILSFELDQKLYEAARKRFAADEHIRIIHGDSGALLGDHLATIAEPCLFWLDGHYSGGITAKATLETPIKSELENILSHPVEGHVILIDDARCFTGANDYPTIQELRDFVFERKREWHFAVETDVIRIHEKQ